MKSTPRAAAAAVERTPMLPPGIDERFAGFGVMGLPFRSGWCLALRSWTATTIGPAYRAVYVRTPSGDWTIQTDAPSERSCPRYVSSAVSEIPAPRPIEVTWTADDALRVTIDGELDWTMTFGDTPAARMMRAAAAAMPERAWRSNGALGGVGAMAGPALRIGRVRLRGAAPNGQWFQVAPLQVWPVVESRATWRGTDLGALGPLRPQTHLADLWMPQQGVFYVGTAVFEQLDPARHAMPIMA